MGVRGDARVPGTAAKPRRARPGQADRRPQPGHGHAADGRDLGARRRDVAPHAEASSGSRSATSPTCTPARYWIGDDRAVAARERPLPLELTPSSYVHDFSAYARVLGEGAPDVPLIGPAVAHPRVSLPWITTLIADERPELGAVSGHLYPYSACVKHPSQPELSDRRAPAQLAGCRGALAKDVAGAVRVAHDAGLRFRLTELNSVTCGGKPGVSNTFATALWAPDALFTLMRAGVDGVNLHVRAYAINAPFSLTRTRTDAAAAAVRPDHVRADARRRCAPRATADVARPLAEPERLGRAGSRGACCTCW